MAWNGRFGDDDEEGSGLELSLGLPGYFSPSRSPTQAAGGAGLEEKGQTAGGSAAARPKGGNGFKARPAAAAPVVGWPPVRAFRRNLASSSSSKPSRAPPSSRHGGADPAPAGAGKKGLFVKINMDGVPIGRKVDLSAHAGYDTLSAAVDHLFRGLLAAQASSAGGEQEAAAAATGILNGRGEYTLVYEDDEGDQMLVGDVPWAMFIAAARRLRVLRSADLSPSSLRGRKRAAAEC
ncbi:hypothetical protein U9M48_042418 [Paspalum notatum var. saurae]|uniref:Auxin-responsive protein n=1 Tax=Paspalum notatum var. saurae TaxID=547442 RepID=A0AAQ3XG51_PASNO